MPNTRSAKKQLRSSRRKAERNKAVKSRIKTEVKKFLAYIEAKDINAAKSQISLVCSLLDKAAKKNIIHDNTASRKKSRLMKRLSLLESQMLTVQA
ncbi:30S ribosomal protein S20 [bacterium]|nr:30S ribosomal protein S20 [bacterium]